MLKQLGINAKTASADLVGASTELKNKALGAIANALIQNAQKIIDANKIDYDSQLGILDGGMLDVGTVFDGISAFLENVQQRRKREAGCNGRVQILPDKIADGGLAAALGVPFCIVLTTALRLNDRKAIFAADLIGNAANIFKVIFERIAIFHSIHE